MVRNDERRVDKGRDDRAGDDVAEVTEGHRDRREDLAQNVKRRHHEDGVAEALEIAKKAVGPELRICNDDEYDNAPCERGRDIRRGRPEADERR